MYGIVFGCLPMDEYECVPIVWYKESRNSCFSPVYVCVEVTCYVFGWRVCVGLIDTECAANHQMGIYFLMVSFAYHYHFDLVSHFIWCLLSIYYWQCVFPFSAGCSLIHESICVWRGKTTEMVKNELDSFISNTLSIFRQTLLGGWVDVCVDVVECVPELTIGKQEEVAMNRFGS